MNYYKVEADAVKVMTLREAANILVEKKVISLKPNQRVQDAFAYYGGHKEKRAELLVDIYEYCNFELPYPHKEWGCVEEPTFPIEELRKYIPNLIGWGEIEGSKVLLCMK